MTAALNELQQLGYPIPWIELTDLGGEDFAKFEAGIAQYYESYVIRCVPGSRRCSTEFPEWLQSPKLTRDEILARIGDAPGYVSIRLRGEPPA